jgi:hypothetical protein
VSHFGKQERHLVWAWSGLLRSVIGGCAMRRFLFLVTTVTAVSTAAAVAPAAARSGAPPVPAVAAAVPALSVSSQLDARRYAVPGDRAYELGTEDGRYPAMGFHTRGEMGGVWTPPVKLLDGIWFGING